MNDFDRSLQINGSPRLDLSGTLFNQFPLGMPPTQPPAVPGWTFGLVLQRNGKWRRECQPGRYFSFLFGFRYSILNEAFDYQSSGTLIDPNGGMHQTSGNYQIFSHNNLVGLQTGAELTWRHCRWEYGFSAKAGPAVNFADQSSTITSLAYGIDPVATTPDFNLQLHASKESPALFAELGAFASYRFEPNFTLRAGYDLTWLTGLALAPEQLYFDASPAEKVVTTGSMFLQGLSLKAEFTW
jgi:hypothetical protein